MWFGLKQLLWQCVFLLDEEIIVYGRARVRFICISRSSPAPRSLSVRLNYAVEEIPPHQTWSGFILFSAACREFFFFILPSKFTHSRNILIAFDNNSPNKRITQSSTPDCNDNHVSSSAVCFQSRVMGIFCWRVNRWREIKQRVLLCVFFVCMCGGEEGRHRAGRIIGLPLITHRWLILGLRVWRCPSIHHFLHTHTATQTQFLSGESQYRGRARVSVRVRGVRNGMK